MEVRDNGGTSVFFMLRFYPSKLGLGKILSAILLAAFSLHTGLCFASAMPDQHLRQQASFSCQAHGNDSDRCCYETVTTAIQAPSFYKGDSFPKNQTPSCLGQSCLVPEGCACFVSLDSRRCSDIPDPNVKGLSTVVLQR